MDDIFYDDAWISAVSDGLREANYMCVEEPFAPGEGLGPYTRFRKRLMDASPSMKVAKSFDPDMFLRFLNPEEKADELLLKGVDGLHYDVASGGGVSAFLELQKRAILNDLAKNSASEQGTKNEDAKALDEAKKNAAAVLTPHGFSNALGFEADLALVRARNRVLASLNTTTSGEDQRRATMQTLIDLPEHILDEMWSHRRLDENGYLIDKSVATNEQELDSSTTNEGSESTDSTASASSNKASK